MPKALYYLPWHIVGVVALVVSYMRLEDFWVAMLIMYLGLLVGLMVPMRLYGAYQRGYDDLRMRIATRQALGEPVDVDVTAPLPHPADRHRDIL